MHRLSPWNVCAFHKPPFLGVCFTLGRGRSWSAACARRWGLAAGAKPFLCPRGLQIPGCRADGPLGDVQGIWGNGIRAVQQRSLSAQGQRYRKAHRRKEVASGQEREQGQRVGDHCGSLAVRRNHVAGQKGVVRLADHCSARRACRPLLKQAPPSSGLLLHRDYVHSCNSFCCSSAIKITILHDNYAVSSNSYS